MKHISLALLLSVPSLLLAGSPASPELANELSAAGQHTAAAVEYRRLALQGQDSTTTAGFFWADAYEYHLAGDPDRVNSMLDRAENASDQVASASALLRGDAAISAGRINDGASVFHTFMTNGLGTPEATTYSSRRLAATMLADGDIEGARDTLAMAGDESGPGPVAIARYASGRDKKPWLGGLLGIVPGLGYAYSGEYANAVRSLILNGLFIYGMVDTADNEQWGAFSVITFFELTWYSGSIYGGLDSVHRHNRQRMESCLHDIQGNMSYAPDRSVLPLVSLQFDF